MTQAQNKAVFQGAMIAMALQITMITLVLEDIMTNGKRVVHRDY